MLIIDPEFQSLIPPLAPEELAQLEANILADGCRDPLVTWNGILIDGHNRHAICTNHGLPFETVAKEFAGRAEARIWMRQNQAGRRNLSAAWRIELELGTKADLLEVGRVKHAETVGRPNKESLSQNDNDSPQPKHDTRKEIAKAAGVSTGQVGMAEQLMKKAPELWEKAKEDEVSISTAYKEMKREEKKAEHAEKVKAAKELGGTPMEFIGPFDIVMADPPWRYDHQEAANREIENHYPTADIAEICTHVPNAKPDSILFLWATAPKIPEALQVMSAWGFTFKTSAVWDKEIIGMGYWFRGQHELLLVGVKGSPGATPEAARRSSIFREKRGPHSKKPQSVYEWVESAFPAQSKLEMYCRTPRNGWAKWGNEV